MVKRKTILVSALLVAVVAALAMLWHFWPVDPQARAARIIDDVRSGDDTESTASSFNAVAGGKSPAISKLVHLGPRIIPVLQNALSERNSDVRVCAAWTLSNFDGTALVNLLPGTKAEDLGPLGRGIALHKELADAVMASAKNPDIHIRKRALQALAESRRKDTTAAFAAALTDSELANIAAAGLRSIGTPEAVDALAAALSGPQGRAAAFALAALRDKRATPKLLEVWKTEGLSRRLLQQLAGLQDERATEVYREALSHPDPEFRGYGAGALITIRTRQADRGALPESQP